MLQGRLTPVAGAATLAVLLAACGDADRSGGAIRGTVETSPAETEREAAACGIAASGLRTALDAYERAEGEPAADEAALVEAGLLRTESELWDVVGGEIVAVAPGCSAVDVDPDAPQIVTSIGPPPSADDVFADFSDDEIDALGGRECALEVAAIYAAGERFVAESGGAPADLGALVDAGLLPEPPVLWRFSDGELIPADGSGCAGLD